MAKARQPRPLQPRWDRRSANAGILSKIKAYRVAFWSRAPGVRAEIIGGFAEAIGANNRAEIIGAFAEAIGANNNAQSYKWYVDDLSVYADILARIDIKAPVGTYEIDGIALDYCARGLLHCGSQVIDGCEATGREPTNDDPVLLVRMCVVAAAYTGIHLLDRQGKTDERLKVTRSHFEDLQVIKTVIRRRDLPGNLMIRRRDGLDDGNEIRDLYAAFEKVDDAIDNYLKAYEPTKARSGNHDYLSSTLINSILELWWLHTNCVEASSRIDLIGRLKDDIPSLIPLLVAAWRDLKFPIEDGRGNTREPLEEWFRNRLLRAFEYDKRRAGNLPRRSIA